MGDFGLGQPARDQAVSLTGPGGGQLQGLVRVADSLCSCCKRRQMRVRSARIVVVGVVMAKLPPPRRPATGERQLPPSGDW